MECKDTKITVWRKKTDTGKQMFVLLFASHLYLQLKLCKNAIIKLRIYPL